MNNNRLANNMFSDDKHPQILIDKIHIIRQITEFLIYIESLRKEINTALMMTLIAEPFYHTFVHIFEIAVIPYKANFINKNTRLFRKINIENHFRVINIKGTGQMLSSIHIPILFLILIR